MIPALVASHLEAHHGTWAHHLHRPAASAQELAAAEHVSGRLVAKPVILRVGSDVVVAVVSAADRVRVAALEEALGRPVELVPEWEFAEWFDPCEPGAEPPLALFGFPILADSALVRAASLVMPGGTHEDAIVVDTGQWIECERVQTIPDLGAPLH